MEGKYLLNLSVQMKEKKQFELSWLRESRLVLLLGDIAIQTARADGWVSINIAGQLVKQHAPGEVSFTKRKVWL
jgi:hypothetical protein